MLHCRKAYSYYKEHLAGEENNKKMDNSYTNKRKAEEKIEKVKNKKKKIMLLSS